MIFDVDDTIAAIATAPGGALRGIVRLSGPHCVAIVSQVVRLSEAGLLNGVRLPCCFQGTLLLGGVLGEVPLVLYVWPTPSSYTRQPIAELHLPGSPPLLEATLRAVCQAGARLAQPGEFTLRAFLAGRLDLTQAEAVLGVIDAANRRELDSALGQLAGGLSRPLARLREELLDLLAEVEAGLDFVEEDIEFIQAAELKRKLRAAAATVFAIADQMRTRGQAGRLPRIVLRGLPNVGKSSLLNALAGDKAAIVSDVPGTTRDYVSRHLKIGQRECLLIDTAGISTDEAGELDRAAQTTARAQADEGDLTLLCIDASQSLTAWEASELELAGNQRLIVWTKCDLAPLPEFKPYSRTIRTSSRTGEGLNELRGAIATALEVSLVESDTVASTADRCHESLRLAEQSLRRAAEAIDADWGDEIIAAEVRIALEALGLVVGAVYTDDILDRVFSRFCIGK